MFGKSNKKKKRVDPKNRVFTDRPRKVFRHYIGASEVFFSAFFILFTAAMGAWFYLQKDNYDPEDRDIKMEILLAQQVEDHLWEPPLKRWVEPGALGELGVGGGAPAVDLKIFPASVLSDGWVDDSRVEVFGWDNLADKINGQETQYKAFGFKSLHFLGIAHPQNDLIVNIELYDMGEFKNALGIFAAQRSANSQVEKHGNAFLYLTEVGALGIAGQYYFKFSGNQESELIQEHALKVVTDFADSIDTSATPKGFVLLAGNLGIDFSGIEYKPEDVFQYAFAKDFWFGKPSPDSTEKYFVHQAASEEEAIQLIDQILEEHQWDYTVVSRDGTRAVLQHDFLKNYFSIDHKDNFVFGVDQAPDEPKASQSLETLSAELFDEAA